MKTKAPPRVRGVCEATVESVQKDKTVKLVQCGHPATKIVFDPILLEVKLCESCAALLVKSGS